MIGSIGCGIDYKYLPNKERGAVSTNQNCCRVQAHPCDMFYNCHLCCDESWY